MQKVTEEKNNPTSIPGDVVYGHRSEQSRTWFKTLPKPNWTITYSGLGKPSSSSPIFRQSGATIRHAYQSKLTINQYNTDIFFMIRQCLSKWSQLQRIVHALKYLPWSWLEAFTLWLARRYQNQKTIFSLIIGLWVSYNSIWSTINWSNKSKEFIKPDFNKDWKCNCHLKLKQNIAARVHEGRNNPAANDVQNQ